jgi:putative NADPH-quinone reductase
MDSWYLKGYFDEIVRIGFRADNSENFFRIYQLKTFKH